MKKSFFLFSSVLFIEIAYSQRIDTVSIETFDNGITLIKYRLDGPKEVFVAEVDLTNPSLSIEAYQPKKLTRTTRQSRENSFKNHEVVAAINADFFDLKTEQPVNNCIVNRHPVKGIGITRRSQFAITTDKKIVFDGFYFHGEVIFNKNKILPIRNLNTAPTKNDAVLFTSYFGNRDLSEEATNIALKPLEGKKFLIGDSLRYIVSAISSSKKIFLEDSLIVIAVTGKDSAQYISNLSLNDTISICANYLSEQHHDVKIAHLVAGWGRLLQNNRNRAALADTNEGLTSKFTAVLHPRTFLGFNRDTTKLFLCVADGRQEQSNGMTFRDMAFFLQHLEVTEAINFDGGGSSTLVVGDKIINSPSDRTGERPVANTIQIIYRGK